LNRQSLSNQHIGVFFLSCTTFAPHVAKAPRKAIISISKLLDQNDLGTTAGYAKFDDKLVDIHEQEEGFYNSKKIRIFAD